ncbi:hypothetical protein Dimus_026326, partial [Dionaea muscipula]
LTVNLLMATMAVGEHSDDWGSRVAVSSCLYSSMSATTRRRVMVMVACGDDGRPCWWRDVLG